MNSRKMNRSCGTIRNDRTTRFSRPGNSGDDNRILQFDDYVGQWAFARPVRASRSKTTRLFIRRERIREASGLTSAARVN